MTPETATGAGYFRVPLTAARAVADATEDPDALAAWLTLRRFAYGRQRELTCAGAKKIAGTLGITRPRAARLQRTLLASCYGERGETAVLMTAADWNAATGQKVPAMKGNALVYVMPDAGNPYAYLPDLLIPPGDARSWLSGLCDLGQEAGMDALRLLLRAYEVTSCGDFIGADPDAFACNRWELSGETDNGYTLGRIGEAGGWHYWLTRETECPEGQWEAVEAVTGTRTEASAGRFWAGIHALTGCGLLYRAAIASDARGRMLYPLWIYGVSHRIRLDKLGVSGNLASCLHRKATRAGFDVAEYLAFDAAGDHDPTGVFIAASPTATPPTIRTVYAPTFIAPTPDNLAGMEAVARLEAQWR